MKIVKTEIKYCNLQKINKDGSPCTLVSRILRLVVDIEIYPTLEKEGFLKTLRKKISNLNYIQLQRLADLFLKHEAEKLEEVYKRQESTKKELDKLLTREREQAEKKAIYKNDSLLRPTIERFLELGKEVEKNSKKEKNTFENSKLVVKMMGLKVWKSHVLYLKLDVESLRN